MAYADKYSPKPATDIFTADTDIDRRTCSRKVPMKVLLLGLGRTGTSSMREAMTRLGYVDTYHMASCSVENPPDALLWMDALRAKYDGVGRPFARADWDRLLGSCQAVCDWPAVAFADELIAAYPEAKVVLTTRDVDAWHASTMATVYARAMDPELALVARVSWAAGMFQPMLRKFFDCFFEGAFPTRGKAIFAAHYAHIRRRVPADRLLEFRVSDGWAPLCRFLGEPLPPPTQPFPRVNDSAAFVARTRRRNRMQMCNVLLRWALTALALGALALVLQSSAARAGLWASSAPPPLLALMGGLSLLNAAVVYAIDRARSSRAKSKSA